MRVLCKALQVQEAGQEKGGGEGWSEKQAWQQRWVGGGRRMLGMMDSFVALLERAKKGSIATSAL